MTITLTPGAATLDQLYALWHDGTPAQLTPDAAPKISPSCSAT